MRSTIFGVDAASYRKQFSGALDWFYSPPCGQDDAGTDGLNTALKEKEKEKKKDQKKEKKEGKKEINRRWPLP